MLRIVCLALGLALLAPQAPGTATVGATAAPPDQHPCRDRPQSICGSVTVPLDRADSSAGTLDIGYQLTPARSGDPSQGTILAVEGGPGYSSIASTSWYRDLYRPLLGTRQMLIVDLRGTGRSGAINCPRLQAYEGNYVTAVGQCGRLLGATSDLYGSRMAAHDVVAVLDHLGIDTVDVYGDSYGTFLAQTFAVNHPDRVRSVVLDSAYFVDSTDPFYPDSNRALRHAFTVACTRDPGCAARAGDPMRRIARLVEHVRRHPIVGRAPNGDGVVKRAVADVNAMVSLVTAASGDPTAYRELDAAARAALRPNRYVLPLLRLVRESTYEGGAGPYRVYSEGLFLAVSCNDYPQPFDINAPIADRPAQWDATLRRLARDRPRVFAPFTVDEWAKSEFGYFNSCLRWPAPSRWVHPVPQDAVYPDLPVLVLAGDLDSNTSSEGARDTAAAFPGSTFVSVHNATHVTATEDFDTCTSLIVRRFVRTLDAGDTSCAQQRRPYRLVDRFVRTAEALHWGPPRRATARVAAATAADVHARWFTMYGWHGVGLRGGTFSYHGGWFLKEPPVVRWRVEHLRWVSDVGITGTMSWNRRTGAVQARLDVRGDGAVPGHLRMRWNDLERRPVAHAVGRLGGVAVDLRFPAP